ncbi:MAG: amidohydrolase family protein [Phycisphaerae bacterium]
MIVDCHTHIWADSAWLGQGAADYLRLQCGKADVQAGADDHAMAARAVARSLVLGRRCAKGDARGVPNDYIAQYVSRNSNKVVGIAGVNPVDDGAVDEAAELLDKPEFRGLTCSPACQNFHPADSRAMRLYELAQQRKAPVIFDDGPHFAAWSRMDYARPMLLDEIAREFPDLVIVVSAMGYPWTDEAIALIGQHPNVLADVAALLRRPWQAYNALVLAYQFNVMDKVLFGSDFPFFTAAEAIESVYRLHEITQGTNMPSVPREALRSMVERDALAALRIARPGDGAGPAAEKPDEEEN